MPVVIQDFEIVADAPPARGEAAESERESAPTATVDAVAIVRMLQAREARALRVWAH
jgi:hypothetical protein